MKARTAFLAAAALCGLCSAAQAVYTLDESGKWPQSWPRQLEPLRKQARTFVGPTVAQQHFAIRFSRREEFESAWTQLLKVKTKGAPVFLIRGPSYFLGDGVNAGVIVHSPPVGQSDNPNTPEAPIPGVTNPRVRWMNTTYLEVVVDGDVIDPDRLRIPAHTPLFDERSRAKPEYSRGSRIGSMGRGRDEGPSPFPCSTLGIGAEIGGAGSHKSCVARWRPGQARW